MDSILLKTLKISGDIGDEFWISIAPSFVAVGFKGKKQNTNFSFGPLRPVVPYANSFVDQFFPHVKVGC